MQLAIPGRLTRLVAIRFADSRRRGRIRIFSLTPQTACHHRGGIGLPIHSSPPTRLSHRRDTRRSSIAAGWSIRPRDPYCRARHVNDRGGIAASNLTVSTLHQKLTWTSKASVKRQSSPWGIEVTPHEYACMPAPACTTPRCIIDATDCTKH